MRVHFNCNHGGQLRRQILFKDFGRCSLQKALIEAIARKRMRNGSVAFKINSIVGEPGARVCVSFDNCGYVNWIVEYTDGIRLSGFDLASLISELFGLNFGDTFMCGIEALFNVELNALAVKEIIAAGNKWQSRVSPENMERPLGRSRRSR